MAKAKRGTCGSCGYEQRLLTGGMVAQHKAGRSHVCAGEKCHGSYRPPFVEPPKRSAGEALARRIYERLTRERPRLMQSCGYSRDAILDAVEEELKRGRKP